MPFMLKIQWDIKAGREADFRTNQEILCAVMEEHPGVICYHADYPSEQVSQWTEIYATNESFKAHLANEKGKEPLGALIDASETINCQCWGDPDDESKEILAGFGATYHETAKNAFVLNPYADKDSLVQPLLHKDNPSEIAKHLAQENGLEGAIQVIRDGIAKAHQDGDNYSLSVWREVRQRLMMESKAKLAGGE